MERRNSPTTHSLEREQWLLGEQSAAERAHTEARFIEGEAARLTHDDAALRAELFASVPPEQLVRTVRTRLDAELAAKDRAVGLRRRYALASVVAAACALFVFLRSPAFDGIGATTAERTGSDVGERAKGVGLELRVFRQRGNGIERLAAGAQVAEHQVLQLGYARGGFTHAVLVSIDGRGSVTLHTPREPGDSTALPTRHEHLLSDAYELDDAPGFERFVLVAADRPLSVPQVLDAARALATDRTRAETAELDLPMPNEQRAVLLRKGGP